MNEHAPQGRKDEKPNEGRRNFLKIFGGAVAGSIVALKGNKYFEQEKELNKYHELFNGNEESFYYGNKAIGYLLYEMEVDNIARVKISGTGSGNVNERIVLLRDFLTKHLNSRVGKKYLGVRDLILKDGVYTTDNLRVLLEVSQQLSLKYDGGNVDKTEETQSKNKPI
ncbi:MAG: hypothetical protein QG653_311 [Patescibacteria group bacterium]|nr:hypothetical protein [Patescibacteria group bacterium]